MWLHQLLDLISAYSWDISARYTFFTPSLRLGDQMDITNLCTSCNIFIQMLIPYWISSRAKYFFQLKWFNNHCLSMLYVTISFFFSYMYISTNTITSSYGPLHGYKVLGSSYCLMLSNMKFWYATHFALNIIPTP